MARTKKSKAPSNSAKLTAQRRELFCRYYAQNSELFGNATLCYAQAYNYQLDELSREAVYDQVENHETGEVERGQLIQESAYDRAYAVCAVESSRLLKNPKVEARITVLLNELLEDRVVDSELARLIRQNHDSTSKIAAIREYNKLRGRITDRSKVTVSQGFGMDDLRAVLSVLPKERQDKVYEIITNAIADAELLRSSQANSSGDTQ